MKNVFITLCIFCCTGCFGPREMKLCRVIDVGDLKPIPGAKVWMQPWAPIHPFWPAGASGLTDTNGEVELSLPESFFFYFSDAKAEGYSMVEQPEPPPMPPGRAFAVFYMKRYMATAAR